MYRARLGLETPAWARLWGPKACQNASLSYEPYQAPSRGPQRPEPRLLLTGREDGRHTHLKRLRAAGAALCAAPLYAKTVGAGPDVDRIHCRRRDCRECYPLLCACIHPIDIVCIGLATGRVRQSTRACVRQLGQ